MKLTLLCFARDRLHCGSEWKISGLPGLVIAAENERKVLLLVISFGDAAAA